MAGEPIEDRLPTLALLLRGEFILGIEALTYPHPATPRHKLHSHDAFVFKSVLEQLLLDNPRGSAFEIEAIDPSRASMRLRNVPPTRRSFTAVGQRPSLRW